MGEDRQYTERVVAYLTPAQRKALDKEAYRKRKSLTEVLRELVDSLSVAK